MSTFGASTTTGLSAMLDGEVSHDRVTRLLSKQDFDSKNLWQLVKPTIRSIEEENGVLIFDDTIQEKDNTDESELNCWHFDHCSGRNVKGINLLNALYECNGLSIPVAFELIKKPIQYSDVKTKQIKRKSETTKNELVRQMILTCIQNQLKFKYVLMDSWFSSEENFEFIVKHKKHFIMAIKTNRLIALSEEDRKNKRYVRVDELEIPENQAVQGWLKGYDKAILLVRQVFTNKDCSTAELHLVCSDLTLNYNGSSSNFNLTICNY